MRGSLMLAAMAMTGACSPKPPAPPAAPPPALEGTAWVLTSLGSTPAGAQVTLRFDGDRANGTDGCNRYTVPVTRSGASLTLGGPGASTQMACPDPVMAQAQAWMQALSSTRTYRVEGGSLQLLGSDGAVLATLAPQATSLAGTSWKVVGVNNGKTAVVSIATTQDITMDFAADGRVAGSAGCNRYTGSYTAEGSSVTFGPAAATRKMCADQAVMEQEHNFLTALGTVRTMQVEGDHLTLRTADGATALTAVKAGS